MLTKIFTFTLFLMIILSFFAVFNLVETCEATGNTIYVDDDGGADYTNIQDAINAANEGDTVYVYSGFYNENIVVSKSISLEGENKKTVIIDGSNSGSVITIYVNGITTSGFTIQNSGSEYYNAGIYISSNYNTISENNIYANYNGVRLSSSSNNIINDNNISHNLEPGDGIAFIHQSNENNIFGNTLIDNFECLWISDSFNNTINENTIKDSNSGIFLGSSSDNIISNNIIDNNSDSGIWHSGSSERNVFSDNTITNNGRYGISMSISSKATITGNTFEYNGNSGIRLENSLSNTITDNSFTSDGISIKGDELHFWNTHVIENNDVNGKSIYYYTSNHEGLTVPSDAGQIILVDCSYFTIQDINIENVNFGVKLKWSSYNTISGNTIINTSDYSIALTESSNNYIINNKIKNGSICGIHLSNSSKNDIIGNHVEDCSWGGICITGSSNNINDNNLSNNRYHGINLNGVTSQNNTISNNTIHQHGTGITISDSNNNTLSENTIIYNINHSSPNSYGIELENSYGNQITNNNITNNVGSGIGLYSSSDYNIISDNTIKESKYWGISIRKSSNNTFTDNIITEGSNDGIHFFDSSNNNAIKNNILTKNNESGINLAESSNKNTISGNKIENNTQDGLYIGGASNNNIFYNEITNNRYGIYLYEEPGRNIDNEYNWGLPIHYPHHETSNNSIFNNTISNNEVGILISTNAEDNDIGENTYFNNGEDVQKESEEIESEVRKYAENIFNYIITVSAINLTLFIGSICWIVYWKRKKNLIQQETAAQPEIEKSKTVMRPTGIAILAILEGFDGVYALLNGLVMIPFIYYLYAVEFDIVGLREVLAFFPDFTSILFLLGIAIITSAALHFILVYGFWKGKGWSWLIGIISPVIWIIISVITYNTISDVENLITLIASIVIGSIIIGYLTRPRVKSYFGITKTAETNELC